jgi:catechol 2,3-dioxygenase-like lactoylglutathione lyase family enzyme
MSNPLENLPSVPAADPRLPGTVELGAFSISLTVADLAASRAFYERLGFEVTSDTSPSNYLIMQNGEKNILTFNPGLTTRMEKLESFTDIRTVHRAVTENGAEPNPLHAPDGTSAAAESGPAMFFITDPDGNPILVDQHF